MVSRLETIHTTITRCTTSVKTNPGENHFKTPARIPAVSFIYYLLPIIPFRSQPWSNCPPFRPRASYSLLPSAPSRTRPTFALHKIVPEPRQSQKATPPPPHTHCPRLPITPLLTLHRLLIV